MAAAANAGTNRRFFDIRDSSWIWYAVFGGKRDQPAYFPRTLCPSTTAATSPGRGGAANPGCRRLSAGVWSFCIFKLRKDQLVAPAVLPPFFGGAGWYPAHRLSIGAPPAFARATLCASARKRRVGKECRSRWSPYH